MAEHEDRPHDGWGDTVAKWTFIWTLILTVLYAGAVALFIF
jgi:hypothetical protein